jgi:hypothetical protein
MELNISFKLPRWHRSLSLSDGNIILTGGVNVEQKNYNEKNTYYLDFERNSLQNGPQMILARSGHAFI